jgi:hypothetical protein
MDLHIIYSFLVYVIIVDYKKLATLKKFIFAFNY